MPDHSDHASGLILAGRILEGDLRSLARAATWIENRDPRAEELLRVLFPHTGRATLIGVTGAPGAGKSTLVSQLTRQFRHAGSKVGVLAVDPSSPFSGGAILGDRIRMQQHWSDSGVFIRSMAARGQLGGLARGALEMSLLMDAAGYETILIETVGVGQDEVEIAGLADVTVVVLVPGMGDEIQALKAGIMEIADVFVINKADHPGARRFEQELRAMLALGPKQAEVPVIATIATEAAGIAEAVEAIRTVHSRKRKNTSEIWAPRLEKMLRERLMSLIPVDLVGEQARRVANRETDPFSAVELLLGKIQYLQPRQPH
jgi:LAO/AO transport system kinase